MFSCSITVHFDAAHRVIGHKGKCVDLHGHRYVLEVSIRARQLDQLGMVIDFSDLKQIIYGWINQNFDHTVILSTNDQELGEAISKITKQKIYYLPYNPTAENIAYHFKNDILSNILDTKDLRIGKVRLYETPSCWVEV
ncbi:6-carboxytetrahydropterin synthase [Candidatus Phycorickettsia trachydisci]|uniref:6-carboxytetrahydropterin synthase n=1 Tax=Candidatus Phycorickettsia trachydisci TaxID=2115978 RepID=UPI000D118713|nr:6-carboxytetrahydropterin synthase [Candidatus Phycorickettsia trachydisci]